MQAGNSISRLAVYRHRHMRTALQNPPGPGLLSTEPGPSSTNTLTPLSHAASTSSEYRTGRASGSLRRRRTASGRLEYTWRRRYRNIDRGRVNFHFRQKPPPKAFAADATDGLMKSRATGRDFATIFSRAHALDRRPSPPSCPETTTSSCALEVRYDGIACPGTHRGDQCRCLFPGWRPAPAFRLDWFEPLAHGLARARVSRSRSLC